MVKMGFSGITPKILTFEYYAKNKTYSEVNFICFVPNLVKIDCEVLEYFANNYFRSAL